MSAANPFLVHVRAPRDDATSDASTSSASKRPRARSHSTDGDNVDETQQSVSDSSSSSKVEATRKKKHKPTYTMRREELQTLSKELHTLEARAEMLRSKLGLPGRAEHVLLEAAQQDNDALKKARRKQLLALCGIHARLGQYMRDQFPSPLMSFVRLGKDMEQRRAQLLAMRGDKLDIARRFLNERLRDVNDCESLNEDVAWTSPEGHFCVNRADIVRFEGMRNVKQVFDALMFFFVNMEISITDVLGQLTIREDIDSVDTQVSNHRFLSTTNHGIVVENNSLQFSEYHESSKEHDGGEFALFLTETVDEDELYPYCPQERVRKDITGVISLSTMRTSTFSPSTAPKEWYKEENNSGGVVVVMRRCAYLRIYRPQFAMSNVAKEDLRVNLANWGDAMLESILQNLQR